MKRSLVLSLIFVHACCFGQTKSNTKTDFNTIFICLDSNTYNKLFQSKYVKDTLFFCREQQQNTTTDSYKGKYLIGESATIEFFKPKNGNHVGDHFGDWGIEFKTRKINILNTIIEKSNFLKFPIGTATTKTILDSLPISWYKTLGFKNAKSELSILEYHKDYLVDLGFTKKQINTPMTFKAFNSILSNGKKYPRQFATVTYIKMYADKKVLTDLQKFAILTNCKKNVNTYTNGEIVIEYNEVEKLPQFPIQEIGISLLNDQHVRVEKISENVYIKINGKKASMVFERFN